MLWLSDHVAAASSQTVITRMPVTPFAPSWSWASVDGPVGYVDRHLDQLTHRRSGMDEISPVFEVLRATAEPATANPYGPVKAGFVTVRGQLLPVVYHFLSETWRPAPRRIAGLGGEAVWGVPRVQPKIVHDVLDEDPRFSRVASTKTWTSEFAMLRVATYIWEGSLSSEGTEVVAMLLVRVPDVTGAAAGGKLYTRRGIVLHAFHIKEVWEGIPTETIVIA